MGIAETCDPSLLAWCTDLPVGMFSDIQPFTQRTYISTDTELLLPTRISQLHSPRNTISFTRTLETHPGGHPRTLAQSHSAPAQGDWEHPHQPESRVHGTSASEEIELNEAISKQRLY